MGLLLWNMNSCPSLPMPLVLRLQGLYYWVLKQLRLGSGLYQPGMKSLRTVTLSLAFIMALFGAARNSATLSLMELIRIMACTPSRLTLRPLALWTIAKIGG